jgi:hypothetical protein
LIIQNAIRNFLKVRTSYDVLPLSFRLIIFDTSLSVKESLNILIQNGMYTFFLLAAVVPRDLPKYPPKAATITNLYGPD